MIVSRNLMPQNFKKKNGYSLVVSAVEHK